MEKVRFGIIGLGNQGSMYAVHLFGAGKIENGVVTAMCDINPAKIEAIKNRPGFEDKAYFENYIEMLKTGGSTYPIDEVKIAGVDLTKKEAFLAVTDRMEQLVNELEKLLNE